MKKKKPVQEKITEFVTFMMKRADKMGIDNAHSYALFAVSTILEITAGKPEDHTIAQMDAVMRVMKEGDDFERKAKNG